jgi:cytochrome c556
MRSVDALISSIREVLREIPSSSIMNLSRETFAELLGIDPRKLPLNYKIRIAKMLYEEFGLSYRWIANRLAMSLRDVAKAVKGDYVDDRKMMEKNKAKTDTDIDIVVKAIELVRAGQARNPNDLVLNLKIDLEQAAHLFNRIIENEQKTITILPILKASEMVKELWKDAVRYVSKLENLIKDMENVTRNAERRKEELNKWALEFQELQKRFEISENDMKIIIGLMRLIGTLEKRVGKLEERVAGSSSFDLTEFTNQMKTLRNLVDATSKKFEQSR